MGKHLKHRAEAFPLCGRRRRSVPRQQAEHYRPNYKQDCDGMIDGVHPHTRRQHRTQEHGR